MPPLWRLRTDPLRSHPWTKKLVAYTCDSLPRSIAGTFHRRVRLSEKVKKSRLSQSRKCQGIGNYEAESLKNPIARASSISMIKKMISRTKSDFNVQEISAFAKWDLKFKQSRFKDCLLINFIYARSGYIDRKAQANLIYIKLYLSPARHRLLRTGLLRARTLLKLSAMPLFARRRDPFVAPRSPSEERRNCYRTRTRCERSKRDENSARSYEFIPQPLSYIIYANAWPSRGQ